MKALLFAQGLWKTHPDKQGIEQGKRTRDMKWRLPCRNAG
jgi:hypothetical protein